MYQHRKKALAVAVVCALAAGQSLTAGESTIRTGSRLASAAHGNPPALTIITRDMINRSGHTSIGDLLQDLPSSSSGLNNRADIGNDGRTTYNHRRLGAERILILLNGERLTVGLNGAVDLNQIALSTVDRIELLERGASAIYGSDAISGVVNIITISNFEGIRFNAQVGQYEPEGDGEIQSYDFAAGAQSDRGTVIFNASFVQNERVSNADRVISAEPRFGTGTAFGSPATPQGQFLLLPGDPFPTQILNLTTDPGAIVTGPGGRGLLAFRPIDLSSASPGSGRDLYNFAPANDLRTPADQTHIFTQATYDLTDTVKLDIEASYNNRRSSQTISPAPLVIGLFGRGINREIGVDVENPFNVFGIDLVPSNFSIRRRLVEAGPRVFRQDVTNYRFSLGAEGEFDALQRPFQWHVDYLFGRQRQSSTADGNVNLQRVKDALSAECVDGTITGCVPLNLFGGQGPDGNGTITDEMLDYILFTQNESTGSDIRSYRAGLRTELLQLPSGSLDVALGLEHREQDGFDAPDALVLSGLAGETTRRAIAGGFSTDDFYLEMAVPILSGRTAAKSLDLTLAARRSDHSTFGVTLNSSIGIQWQPTDELLISTYLSRDFREPGISQLFLDTQQVFSLFNDPCTDGFNELPPEAMDFCVSQGIPAGGLPSPNESMVVEFDGGNVNLEPERSDYKDVTVQYSPAWLDGLTVSVQAYSFEVNDQITSFSAQTILDSCVLARQFCDRITRDSNGLLTVIDSTLENTFETELTGVDLSIAYQLPEFDWGQLDVRWAADYQSDYDTVALDTTRLFRRGSSSTGISSPGSVGARWRSSLDVVWLHRSWQLNWGMQYLHPTRELCSINEAFGFCNIESDGSFGPFPGRRIGSTVYHDVQFSYQWAEMDTEITLGIDNLFDEGPPISSQAEDSFYTSDYRIPGRFPYIRVSVDF